jgi:putative transposase
MTMAVSELREQVPTLRLCEALQVSRAGIYRAISASTKVIEKTRAVHPRALSSEERQAVLDILHCERFMDSSPAETYATLLDEGRYLCSPRTMYRMLSAQEENCERRRHHQPRQYHKPQLLATAPNQVWSWDITKLLGPEKWTYFYLYVLLDIFSRYVVGWMVAERESGHYAKALIEESLRRQNIQGGGLVIHSDRGSPMKSKPVAFLLADLGLVRSLSRPHVSDDNPFSEANFKTMKYAPSFPERFGSLQDSRSYFCPWFGWYNDEHKHSGIGYYTPGDVHYGRATELYQHRNEILRVAYASHPERFVAHKVPTAAQVPTAVWINPPKEEEVNKDNLIIV